MLVVSWAPSQQLPAHVPPLPTITAWTTSGAGGLRHGSALHAAGTAVSLEQQHEGGGQRGGGGGGGAAQACGAV